MWTYAEMNHKHTQKNENLLDNLADVYILSVLHESMNVSEIYEPTMQKPDCFYSLIILQENFWERKKK